MEAAIAAWRDFESNADFDKLTSGEFRLVSLAAKRASQLSPESTMRPRIAGIERAIWSRNQLAIGETTPALRALQAASVEMLAIKGASQAARGDPMMRGRTVNDVDIVVRPQNLERAFDIVIDKGWVPAGSGTALFHRGRLTDAVALNLVRGEFGNLDLHRTPFHPPYDRDEDDSAIWDRSQRAKLGYTNMRIPSPTDAISIAIAHGALDAHKSSDWLVDIAVSIDQGVDWALLVDILERRGMQAAGAIALGYARERLERPVPTEALQRISRAASRRPIALTAAIAETRPKPTGLGVFWLARAWAKQSRLYSTHRKKGKASRIVLASLLPGRPPVEQRPMALEQILALSDRRPGEAWAGMIDVTLLAALPAAGRRVDFEVNTKTQHHLRLRALVRNQGARERPFRFRFALSIPPDESNPVIAAAPSRSFNTNAPQGLIDRYRPVEFRVLSVEARKSHPY
jgi:hypothetical protein